MMNTITMEVTFANTMPVDLEFDFKAESVVVDLPLPHRSKTRQIGPPSMGLHIQLVHRQTGRSAEIALRHFSADNPAAMQHAVQRLILKYFGDTATAQRIRRDRNEIPVAFRSTDHLVESIGERFHVALRKYTDGPASALWWRMISRMPGTLYILLCERTAFDLQVYAKESRALGRPMQLASCMTLAKNGWESTLDLARQYFDKSRDHFFIEDLLRMRAESFQGAQWPDRGALTLYELDALTEASQEAYTAIDLLTRSDWASMLWTVVEETRTDEDAETAQSNAQGVAA